MEDSLSTAGQQQQPQQAEEAQQEGSGHPVVVPTGKKRYVKGRQLGKGQFGVVYQALDTVTGCQVAIKKISLGAYKDGVNVTALREIKLLRELRHPNVVEMVDVFPNKRNLKLVFELMETDLEAIIHNRSINLSAADIKSCLQMTLTALAYVHKKWIIHRDMKPNNLLIAPSGVLKLGDFGLARIFGSPDRVFTNQVFAVWYRAPELLFGSKTYGSGVDMWAVGCVFAEMMLRRPLFQGSSDIDQLGKIFALLGTPTEAQWPDMRSLPDYVDFNFCPKPNLKSFFPMASEDALDLLSRMLTFDPNQRITAQEALEHRYFLLGPQPTPPEQIPRPPPRSKASDQNRTNNMSGVAPGVESPSHPAVLSPGNRTKAVRLAYRPSQGGLVEARPGDDRGQGRGDVRTVGADTSGDGKGHGVLFSDPKKNLLSSDVRMAGGVGETPSRLVAGVPMSIDTTIGASSSLPPRPKLNSTDRKYLKRKLAMDSFDE